MHTKKDPPQILIASLKAFGDFVIALQTIRNVLNRADGTMQLGLVAAHHLRDLAYALGAERDVVFISSGEGLPAAFDFNRRGLWRGLGSVLQLRAGLQHLPRDCELIFDELGWRQNFIAASYRRRALIQASNIYIAFTETLRQVGFDLADEVRSMEPLAPLRGRLARVFPSSRNQDKCVPPAVTARLVNQLSQAGLECEVIELQNEGWELPRGLPIRKVERNFAALIEVISQSDLIVTADSLPAHLAEYLGVTAYVVSPRDNSYWLPLSCFNDRAWSLFEDEVSLPRWLAQRS